MKIIIMGAPGSGKGTLSNIIKKKLKLDHISTGDLIRTELNKNEIIKNLNKNGKLIPDNIILKLIEHKIKKDNLLLDGIPRTLNQAKIIYEKNIKINYIINVIATENIIIKRLKYRITKKENNYNIIFNKPKIKNKDDKTGEKLIKRKDDNILIIKIRLKDYYLNNEEIINWYKKINTKIIEINSDNTQNTILKKIKENIYEQNI